CLPAPARRRGRPWAPSWPNISRSESVEDKRKSPGSKACLASRAEGGMRVLVIGGTRFLGPRMVERLGRSGHQAGGFHRGHTAASLPAAVRHIPGDRRRLAAYAAEFRRLAPDVVVDMLAFTEHDARSLISTFAGLAGRAVVLSSGDVYRAYGVFTGLE